MSTIRFFDGKAVLLSDTELFFTPIDDVMARARCSHLMLRKRVVQKNGAYSLYMVLYDNDTPENKAINRSVATWCYWLALLKSDRYDTTPADTRKSIIEALEARITGDWFSGSFEQRFSPEAYARDTSTFNDVKALMAANLTGKAKEAFSESERAAIFERIADPEYKAQLRVYDEKTVKKALEQEQKEKAAEQRRAEKAIEIEEREKAAEQRRAEKAIEMEERKKETEQRRAEKAIEMEERKKAEEQRRAEKALSIEQKEADAERRRLERERISLKVLERKEASEKEKTERLLIIERERTARQEAKLEAIEKGRAERAAREAAREAAKEARYEEARRRSISRDERLAEKAERDQQAREERNLRLAKQDYVTRIVPATGKRWRNIERALSLLESNQEGLIERPDLRFRLIQVADNSMNKVKIRTPAPESAPEEYDDII